jgi:hypothetical protein
MYFGREKMKNYRMNAKMTGILYFLGTVFGIMSTIFGGKVISSIVETRPLSNETMFQLITTETSGLLWGAIFILLMGISLVGMTVFLYPVIKRDSEELAMGMLLFRGVMEGIWYFLTTVSVILLFVIGNQYLNNSTDQTIQMSIASIIYGFQDLLGPVGTILFLIGATCIYISFYKTKLIPRWLSIWGLVGVVPYMAYAILHLFGKDSGIGFYLQMILAPQEIIMAFWLIIKGFNISTKNLEK